MGVHVLPCIQVVFQPVGNGIGNENDTIGAAQHQLSAGFVVRLSGHSIQLNFGSQSTDFSQFQLKEVKEQSAVFVRFKGETSSLRRRGSILVWICSRLVVLPTQSRAVVNNFQIDFAQMPVDEHIN